MSDRADIDQATLTAAVIEHLCNRLALDANRCRLVVDPMSPGTLPGGDWWLSVSYSDGDTDRPMFDGGGDGQLVETVYLTVTGYSRIKTDPTGNDSHLLLDATRGLLPIKKKIMQALAGQDPKDRDNAPFLRGHLQPVHATAPSIMTDGDTNKIYFGMIAVTFEIMFDWDLTNNNDTDPEED